MSKHESIARITAACEQLDKAQVAEIEQLASSMLGPSVYSTLPLSERAKIDEAIEGLDGGERISGPEFIAQLKSGITAAKAALGK